MFKELISVFINLADTSVVRQPSLGVGLLTSSACRAIWHGNGKRAQAVARARASNEMSQLLNPLASAEQVARTPSRRDGIPYALEEELRAWGCQIIQQAGVLLALPQVTMATAQVLFQRFWYVSSFTAFDLRQTALGALFLACKLEETPKRVRDLINVFDFLIRRARHTAKYRPGTRSKQLRHARSVLRSQTQGKRASSPTSSSSQRQEASVAGSISSTQSTVPPFEYQPMAYFCDEFYNLKDDLVVAEMQILKRLGFQVQVNLPYATMVNYLQLLGLTTTSSSEKGRFNDDKEASSKEEAEARQHDDSVAQRAWALLNDALQTAVYVLFPPHVLAAASIYLVAITMPACPPLPLEPHPWWELFDVTRAELRIVASHLLRLYDDDYQFDDKEEILALDPAVPDNEEERQHVGLAARVREEWGGMSDFCSRSAVRDWLTLYGIKSITP